MIKLIKKLVGKDIADIGFGSIPISLAGILSLIKFKPEKLRFDISGLEWLIAPLAVLVTGAVWIVFKWRRRRSQRDLPSYLVLGAAGSGARELLKRSGLSEASTVPHKAPEADLKIEENAVTLERLGRYVLYESDENDAEKWHEFLTELKHNLQGQSIKGVLVVLDTVTDLTEDTGRTNARSIRARLAVLQEILGINPPIYLICTEGEQLPGFVDYFRELNDESRAQPWGVAFTGEQQDYLPATLARQLEVMRLGLIDRRLITLYAAPSNAKSNIFRFPIEFGKTSKALRSFVPAMIGFSTPENGVRLRGIYFTGFAKPAESDKPCGYFIKNLLGNAIPRDQELAQPTPKSERQKWLKRMAYATAAFAMILVLLFGGAGFRCSGADSEASQDENNGQPDGSTRPINGIDVSHHQGSINWEDVRGAGYRFAFIKATEATTFVDPKFKNNRSQAKSAGMIVGFYHYFGGGQKPAAQARNFIRTIGELAAEDLPPVLVLEKQMEPVQPSNGFDQRVLRWLTVVQDSVRRKPIIYASRNFANRHLKKKNLADYPLWLASYSTPLDSAQAVELPRLWQGRGWNFWQHTNRDTVAGIDGLVDGDLFDGTLDDLRKFIRQSANP